MAEVSVGTSPTKIVDVDSGFTRNVLVQNRGSANIAVSRNSSVSTSGSNRGFTLFPDDGMSFEARSDVYAIAASGTQSVAVVDI